MTEPVAYQCTKLFSHLRAADRGGSREYVRKRLGL